MLHAAETITASEANQILGRYLAEWQSLAATYGGGAQLVDETFVGATREEGGQRVPVHTGTVIPKPPEYFTALYQARASYQDAYIKPLCKVKVDGKCATYSDKLRPMGAWPEPEAEGKTMSDNVVNLSAFLSMGMADVQEPYDALVPPPSTSRRRSALWIGAAAAVALASGAGVVVAAKRRGRR
jgi:hypothetical protein